MDEQSGGNKKTAKECLDIIIEQYLESNPMMRSDGLTNEIEMRFGNDHKISKITKIDYDNVAQTLCNHGFKFKENFHSLRIFHEFKDVNTGKIRDSNIRAEVIGTDAIKQYCETNSLEKLISHYNGHEINSKLKFTLKQRPKYLENGIEVPISSADFNDFNVRVSYQLERIYNKNHNLVQSIIENWNDVKKKFRLLNRVRFYHETLPIFADLSIIKMSKTSQKNMMKSYGLSDSGLLDSTDYKYEIEMELDNSKIGNLGEKEFQTIKGIQSLLRKVMRIVLCGIQKSKYPISFPDMKIVQKDYMKMIHGSSYDNKPIVGKNFIGPNSKTLRMEHIQDMSDENINGPNIRINYTVTDKADGERRLLYIDNNGKFYMIDTNMRIVYTGAELNDVDRNKKLCNSILDGEYITQDKKGNKMNLYAAFDIYYIDKESVRDYTFLKTNDEPDNDENKKKPKKYRLELLNNFVAELKLNENTDFIVKAKKFESTNNKTIFEGCAQIIHDIKDESRYPYETDGLVFTPMDKCVGSNNGENACQPIKKLWDYSLKWKPTITFDFLVSLEKDETGKDKISNIFESGKSLQTMNDVKKYKTMILRTGFNERNDKFGDGYYNPFNDLINEVVHQDKEYEKINDSYKALPFQPTDPFDPNAYIANIMLTKSGNNMTILSQNNEEIEDNMIVEFEFNIDASSGWKWNPLKVRYDKTSQLRNGEKNYGNPYVVSNENWNLVHYPITEEMISKGINIPHHLDSYFDEEKTADQGAYYNRKEKNVNDTRGLRDFHNLFVKSKLINSVSSRGQTLMDFGVGKAGDLHKWSKSNLSFVYGIDISRDNIHNRLDGACARYLDFSKTRKNIPAALFVNGNCSLNIRNGDAFKSPFGSQKDKEISNAIFGKGPKDPSILGTAVYKRYGDGQDGFNIVSSQFTMHYFFETLETLHNFIRNLAECTKLNGYFIGTCYDGDKVFNLLSDKQKNDSFIIKNEDEKIFELTKLYDQTGFLPNETSLGYDISVFQSTIGKHFKEYLVNFEYFQQVMSNYGFFLINDDEAKQIDMPNSNGSFYEMFNIMESELKKNPQSIIKYKNANKMTANEKTISFMNKYFVFQKKNNVNADKIMQNFMKKNPEEVNLLEEPKVEESKQEDVKQEVKKKKTVTKQKKKIKIQKEED